ncbi:MAG: tetratricopeptide repeat protein [Chlorobi bacterium]|nr:tetratricopeptide repeat protein [Chlorobiota bacterium]
MIRIATRYCCMLALLLATPLPAVAEPAAIPAAAATSRPVQQNTAAQLAQGKALFTGRQYDEAKKVFEQIAINTTDPKAKILHTARLWLAKTLFMQGKAEEAVSQLEILLKNPADDGLEPATIYEAHFDLAACRFAGGKTMQAARDYFIVGQSAAPAGMEKVRDMALANTRLLVCTMLNADETAELERMAKHPDMQAFLLNERLQKHLRGSNTEAFRNALPGAAALQATPSLSPVFRELLASLKEQEKAVAAGKMNEQRIGILLPLEFTVYQRTPAPPGNRVFFGIYSRVLQQQIMYPSHLLSIATASTVRNGKNAAGDAAGKLASSHKPAVIVGPLFSGEAAEAAHAAKREKVPMITPTATDSRITENNPWCFQLNPNHEERGRIAARELLKTAKPATALAIAGKKTILEEMAKGFLDELKHAGTKTVVYSPFSGSAADSAATAKAIGRFAGKPFDALYLPMDDPALIDKTLALLEAAKTGSRRFLGSGVWDDTKIYSRFKSRLPGDLVFFSDYYPENLSGKAAEMARSQRLFWNSPLSPYFWYGYDTLDYLANLLLLKPLKQKETIAGALREAPVFKAHYISYLFGGGNVNRYMNVLRYDNNSIRRIR